jgi:hypothetical protein
MMEQPLTDPIGSYLIADPPLGSAEGNAIAAKVRDCPQTPKTRRLEGVAWAMADCKREQGTRERKRLRDADEEESEPPENGLPELLSRAEAIMLGRD